MSEAHRGPMYRRIAMHIERAIEDGRLSPGDRMPSLRRMSLQFNCSVSTVIQAYEVLEMSGRIYPVERSGFFVGTVRKPHAVEHPSPRTTPPGSEVVPLSTIGRIVEASNDRSIVSLGAGLPAPSMLPLKDIVRHTTRVAKERPSVLHSYGKVAGSEALRTEVARLLSERNVFLRADDLIVTNGCIEALSIAIQITTRPSDAIAVEEPVFLGILQLLRELGRRAVTIPTSPYDGINLDRLEEIVHGRSVKAVILTAIFQNPTGFVVPVRNRKRAVEICEQSGVPLIEDDVYGELSFDGDTEYPLKSFDGAGNVLFCSSVSKTLGPGNRLGWLAAGRYTGAARALKVATSLGESSLLQEGLAAYFATAKYRKHIASVGRVLQRHAFRLIDAVERHFPEPTKTTRPTGGYYLWVQLPGHVDSVRLFEDALRHRIGIVPGPAFSRDGAFRNYVRLSFGMPIDERVTEAVAQLGHLCERQLSP